MILFSSGYDYGNEEDDDYEYEEDDDCDEECMDDGIQLLQIGLGILGALIAFCCCGCFCKWFCADDEKRYGFSHFTIFDSIYFVDTGWFF